MIYNYGCQTNLVFSSNLVLITNDTRAKLLFLDLMCL